MAKLSRTVALSGTPLPSAQELRWSDKDPGDILDYKLDATSFNAAVGGDAIIQNSVTLTATPAGPAITLTACDGNVLTWMIGGGTLTSPVTDYACVAVFSTTGGRTVRRTIWMRVQTLSPNESFPIALSLVEGLPGVSITEVTLNGSGQLVFIAGTEPLTPVAVTPAIAASSALRPLSLLAPTGMVLVLNAGKTDTAVITLEDLGISLNANFATQAQVAEAVLAETNRAIGIEDGLQNQVTALEQAGSGITQMQLNAAVAAEASLRGAADSVLATGNSNEAAARIAEDAYLQNQIITLQNNTTGGGSGGTITLPLNAGFISTNGVGAAVAGAFGTYLQVGPGNTLNVIRTGLPINYHAFVQSLPAAGLPQILVTIDVGMGEAAAYAANLAGSTYKSNIAFQNQYVITILHNGSAIGTITYAAGGFVGVKVSTAFNTAQGDVLQLVGQTTPDVAGAGLRMNTYGTLL